jgi:hypothetical protein
MESVVLNVRTVVAVPESITPEKDFSQAASAFLVNAGLQSTRSDSWS